MRRVSYPSTKMQSVYFTTLGDWANYHYRLECIWSNNNEGIPHILQSSRTGGSLSYPGHLLMRRSLYPTSEMQLGYSTAQVDWAVVVGRIIPMKISSVRVKSEHTY